MVKGFRYPYIRATIVGYEDFLLANPDSLDDISNDDIIGFQLSQGQPGTTLLIVEYRDGTHRRFMVPPTSLVFECGPGEEIDIDDPRTAPKILVPQSSVSV